MATTTTPCLGLPDAAPRRPLTVTLSALRGAAREGARAWHLRARTRAQLRALLDHGNDRLLQDIGIQRVDALREADKPFWRP